MEIRSGMSGWDSSVQGYQKAETSLESRARNISRWSQEAAADKPTAPTSDPVRDVVGMKTDKLAGSYNLKALKVQNNMAGELMDLIG
jgi:hypothetical protein